VGDVGFIFEETWHGKSFSGSAEKDKVTLTRWDKRLPYQLGNMVCMTRKEAEDHDILNPEKLAEHYTADVLELVAKKFAEEAHFNKYRG
jgi:tRNA threonylcarbamoyladenosine dehydratase